MENLYRVLCKLMSHMKLFQSVMPAEVHLGGLLKASINDILKNESTDKL